MTANLTSIAWAHFTINFGRGCVKISPECRYCYSHRDDRRWGKDFSNIRHRPQAFLDMVKLSRKVLAERPGEQVCVFMNSMTDTFLPAFSWEYVAEMLTVCALTPNLTYMILTKRARHMRRFFTDRCRCGAGHEPTYHLRSKMAEIARKYAKHFPNIPDIAEHVFNLPHPLPNVWGGVSAGMQLGADLRIPMLNQTPLARRFVSVEPLLKPVRLSRLHGHCPTHDFIGGMCISGCPDLIVPDTFIIGGESGFKGQYRPMDIDWVRPLVGDIRSLDSLVFVKQLGTALARKYKLRDWKGENWDEWPDELGDLRIRELPESVLVS